MNTINLNNLELMEFVAKEDKQQHCKSTFPMIGRDGTEELACVYFELEPGDNLGSHTDSAEELLIVLQGKIEVTIGDEKNEALEGGLALVPKMMPHDMKNIGNEKARVLGVFGGANNIVATFEKDWLPTNTNIVDTSQL